MLFLLRPRQTWMPYGLPRDPAQLEYRNQQLRQAYADTRRVEPTRHEQPGGRDVVAELKDLASLRESGALTDTEFEAAKARVLNATGPAS